MVHAVAEHNARRSVLIGGVGRSIHDACTLAKASRAAGADALMVHQPPDPFVSPRGVVSYIQRIADDIARSYRPRAARVKRARRRRGEGSATPPGSTRLDQWVEVPDTDAAIWSRAGPMCRFFGSCVMSTPSRDISTGYDSMGSTSAGCSSGGMRAIARSTNGEESLSRQANSRSSP